MNIFVDLFIRKSQHSVATLFEVCVLSFVAPYGVGSVVPIDTIALNDDSVRQKKIYLELIKHYNLLLKRYAGFSKSVSHRYFYVRPVITDHPEYITEQMMGFATILFTSLSAWIGFEILAAILAYHFYFGFPLVIVLSSSLVPHTSTSAFYGTEDLLILQRASKPKFIAAISAIFYNYGFFVNLLASVSRVDTVFGTEFRSSCKLRIDSVLRSTLNTCFSDKFHSSLQKVNPAGAASVVQADPIRPWGSRRKEKTPLLVMSA